MKTFEEDKELRQFLRSMKLESPGVDFSTRVMNRVFEEQPASEKVKPESIFSRGFWIILALFAGLIASYVLLSGNIPALDSPSAFLPDVNTDAVITGYRSFFEKLNALPASIAGIFLAASLLVFLEKFLGSRSHVLS